MSEERQAPAAAGPGADRGGSLMWAVREVKRAMAELNAALARRVELSPTDMTAMEHLLGRPEIGPVELGRLLGMTSASATALIDRLEGAGHVERQRDDDDRRRVHIHVTERAHAAVLAALGPLIERVRALEEAMTPVEQAIVLRYLEETAAIMRAFADENPADR